VGIFRDVSEARRLAEELETARQRAGHSQKIEALGRMAGGVAHDFNNLLTTIVFNLEAAKATLEPDSGAAPYLEEMELATDKACSVTRQLLLYSRKKPAEPRLVSCHDAIRDAGRLTQGIRGSVRLQTRLEAGEDKVLLDDGQLDQVLLNLLVNAKDALGKQGLIEISTENKTIVEETSGSQQMMVALTVKDNGPGIPKEIQSKIFEPYFTTKEVGKGTGLGLSTALAIIEKAGGQLLLISSPGGTTFQIVLPVAIAVPSVKAASPAPPSIPTTAEPAVLLVEDETSIRDLLQRLLEQRGYRVTSAATGSAAAEILTSKEVFDVLVTDLVLPGLSGPELAKVFHKTRPGSPVLYMSGFPGDTLDETEIGNNSRFLAKPFSHDQLLGTLRQLLGEPV
jgi:nitrogen-specific signal transduction histidine kinase/CheY-like chemotaxis protein